MTAKPAADADRLGFAEGGLEAIGSLHFLKGDITVDFIVKACTSALNKLIVRLIVNDKITNLQNIKTVD